ncbi:MAG: glycosyltransferase family 2 protein [Candidatus Muirbacterium halophilum]|nr:glycosyltransferase family 2 protein [Candidatus Muirbacterium halophilum]MCK9477650.1 glycosyltransferase family 2 protein [Candidatus Muirbacterium halophilum]
MNVFLIPVFNEIDFLSKVILSIDKISDKNSIKIFVDDGSLDGSFEYLQSLHRKDFHILKNNKNYGMGKALKKGFDYILKNNSIKDDCKIITVDGDDQHDVSDLNDYLKFFDKKNLDVMIMRRKFDKYPFYKKTGNFLLSKITSFITGYKFYDVESGFRIFHKKDLGLLIKYYRGYRYSCAQEIAVIFAMSSKKINNNVFCDIKHYRSNTSYFDFIINIAVAIITYYRMKKF